MDTNMNTQLNEDKEETPEEEFITILKYLVHNDLAVLHQVLTFENEEEQIKCLREMRSYMTSYPSIYNAYTARVLVTNPNTYISNEIVSRFKKLYLTH
jgi:hypothetical protein